MSKPNLSPHVRAVLNALVANDAVPFLVGGFVRDTVLGLKPKDFDIEVFNIAPHRFVTTIEQFGQVKLVGESFGVFKLRLPDGSELDLSLPRKDNKRGAGHRGFDVEVDPFMPIEQAVMRRDFTMNAMLMNPFTGHIIDPANGRQDIRDGLLRATSPAFAEDPLRVLRGMQFAARFGMRCEFRTMRMAEKLKDEFHTIATERVWGEWEKFFRQGKHPELGLKFLRDTRWLEFFPEVENLIGTIQDPDWHPEGDVWTHTGMVMAEMVRIADRDNLEGDERTIAMAAALVHDFGKPLVTEFSNGHVRSPGHDREGVKVAGDFFKRIGAPEKIALPAIVLTDEHMAHIGVTPNPRIVRRLANRLAPHSNVVMWERVVEADASGRRPLPPARPAEAWVEIAKDVQADKGTPKPIIGGAMLIARGFKPGPKFRPILDAAFNAQLDGDVDEDNAERWLDIFLLENNLVTLSPARG